jgi:hypothetical protein
MNHCAVSGHRWLEFGSLEPLYNTSRENQRCESLMFKDNREQNIGVRLSLALQWPDSIQNEILLFLSDTNEVHRFRVLCARRSFALIFVREMNHERKWPNLGLLKLRRPRAAAISLIAIEDFVIAEEFNQIYSLSNLWQPRIRNASVKTGNQISHKSSIFPLTLAGVRQDWGYNLFSFSLSGDWARFFLTLRVIVTFPP